jgi:N-acetyl-anhydromuramyl-L-alanine amidase AmpD
MRKRKLLALTTVGILLHLFVHAQQPILGLETYFEEAYWRYPNIPHGVLEAAAYSASRMTNLQPSPNESDNCTGMPHRFGLFGLIENGRGYFKNNLWTICNNSHITPEQYNKDVRLQILAVAKYLSREASIRQMDVRMSAEDFAVIFDRLAEFPDDSSAINKYALALYKYDIYDQLQRGINTPSLKRAPVKVKMEQIFPAPLLRKLQSPAVEINVSTDSIIQNTTNPVDANSTSIFATNRMPDASSTTNETADVTADYPSAIYVRANANNYKIGRNNTKITNITIHTTQSSYAGTVSWFKNPAAAVSTHYIIRSTDGQITQMVKESDMAYHVQSANAYTIGIDHEGYVEQGNKWYTDKMYLASVELVRNICARRGIDETACYRGLATSNVNLLPASIHIKGHQHYNGQTHTDPGKYWNWNKYADMLLEKNAPDKEKDQQFMTIPNGIYRITNVGSKKVMNTRDCSGAPLTRVTQTAWNGQDCQRWRFEYAGDGWYKVISLVSGRALDVPGGSKDNIQVHLKDPKENDCQLWRLLEEGSKGELRMVNKASGKVLEVFAGSANNGAAVLQSAWNGKSRQKWTLVAVNATELSNDDHRFRQVHLETTEAIPTGN